MHRASQYSRGSNSNTSYEEGRLKLRVKAAVIRFRHKMAAIIWFLRSYGFANHLGADPWGLTKAVATMGLGWPTWRLQPA